MAIQPGRYRIPELALRAKVTRTTVDKWQERYELEKVLVEHEGREVAAYVLDEEKLAKILKDYPALDNGVDDPNTSRVSMGYHSNDNRDSIELNSKIEVLTTQCEDLKVRMQQLQDENQQLKQIVESVRSENVQEKIKSAKLEKDVERLEALNSQLDIRLTEKDDRIENLKDHIESEKSRAESFNNQIRGLNDKLQVVRGNDSAEDMERWMQAAYEKQKQEIAQILADAMYQRGSDSERQQTDAEQLRQENERLQKQAIEAEQKLQEAERVIEQSKKTGLLGRIFGKK